MKLAHQSHNFYIMLKENIINLVKPVSRFHYKHQKEGNQFLNLSSKLSVREDAYQGKIHSENEFMINIKITMQPQAGVESYNVIVDYVATSSICVI